MPALCTVTPIPGIIEANGEDGLSMLSELQLSPDCVAKYGEREVEVSATHDTEVIVPLPPRSHVADVALLGHDGTETPHRWSPDPRGALVWVPAATSASRAVRIRW